MGLKDKAENKVENLKGQGKESAGKATGGTAGKAGSGTGGSGVQGVNVLQHHNNATRDGVYTDADGGFTLALPEGWTYRTRILDEELVVDTTATIATVLQDELENTYTLPH